MKKISILILLLFIIFSCFASNPNQRVIPLSSPIYQKIDTLFLLEGKANVSKGRPWTTAEAKMILSQIDVRTKEEQQIFEEIEKELLKEPKWNLDEKTSVNLDLKLNLEFYSHTNSSFNRYEDWKVSYVDRKPLLNLSLEFVGSDFFYYDLDFLFGYGLYKEEDDISAINNSSLAVGCYPSGYRTPYGATGDMLLYSQSFVSNFITNTMSNEYAWSKRGVLALGGENCAISYNRDKLDWGNSHIGNFIYDNHLDFLDYFRLVYFSPNFKAESLFAFLSPYQAAPAEEAEEDFRIFLTHRLEFSPIKSLRFALSGGVMYYNKEGALNLAYINPATIYHNVENASMFNALASLEADWAFYPGWKLYVQGVMDQFTTANENSATAQPEASGLIGGIEFATPWLDGIYTSSFEIAKTSPALYRRNKVDFIIAQKRLHRISGAGGYFYLYDYLGFPYGGDCIAFSFDNSLLKSGWKFDLNFLGVLHGPTSMTDTFSSLMGRALFSSQSIDGVFDLTLKAEKTILLTVKTELAINLQLDLIDVSSIDKDSFKFSNNKFDTQIVTGLTYSY